MGVTKQVLKQGDGSTKPKAGDNVSMVYTGWLEDSSKSDNKGMQYVFSVQVEPSIGGSADVCV